MVCNDAYEPGPNTVDRRCLADGSWTGEAQTCIRIERGNIVFVVMYLHGKVLARIELGLPIMLSLSSYQNSQALEQRLFLLV